MIPTVLGRFLLFVSLDPYGSRVARIPQIAVAGSHQHQTTNHFLPYLDPEAPSTQYLRFVIPNAMKGMVILLRINQHIRNWITIPSIVFGTKDLKSWVLGALGSITQHEVLPWIGTHAGTNRIIDPTEERDHLPNGRTSSTKNARAKDINEDRTHQMNKQRQSRRRKQHVAKQPGCSASRIAASAPLECPTSTVSGPTARSSRFRYHLILDPTV